MEKKQSLNDTFFVKRLRLLLLKFMNGTQQTQAEFSRTLGLSRWQISRYNSEESPQVPSRETLCKILDVTGTELRLTYEHQQPDGSLETRTEVMDFTDPERPLPSWLHHRLKDYMEGRHPNTVHKRYNKKEVYLTLFINKQSFETFYGGHYTTELSHLAFLFDLLGVSPTFEPRPSIAQPMSQAMAADNGEENAK